MSLPVTEKIQDPVVISETAAESPRTKAWHLDLKFVNLSSIVFAVLQSMCTAVIAISGLRVAIGLGALAAAAGVDAPARGFHQDAIRIPMMALALAGESFRALARSETPQSPGRAMAPEAALRKKEKFRAPAVRSLDFDLDFVSCRVVHTPIDPPDALGK